MKIVECYAEGWSLRRIARELNICRKDVASVLRAAGITPSAKRPRSGDWATRANGRHRVARKVRR